MCVRGVRCVRSEHGKGRDKASGQLGAVCDCRNVSVVWGGGWIAFGKQGTAAC